MIVSDPAMAAKRLLLDASVISVVEMYLPREPAAVPVRLLPAEPDFVEYLIKTLDAVMAMLLNYVQGGLLNAMWAATARSLDSGMFNNSLADVSGFRKAS